MKKCLILLIMLMLLAVSCGGGEDSETDSDELSNDSDTFNGSEVIKFKDANLEKCVRSVIQKPEGEIAVEDVKNVKTILCDEMGILTIDGIEKLINISYLSLTRNDIKDFSLLKNLKSLKTLGINGNVNVDIKTLGELNSLEDLRADNCGLTELGSIVELAGLKKLDIQSNNIKSIEEVKNLTGLKNLSIPTNNLENDDLPVLLNLKNLEHLNIRENCITDFTVIDQMKENLPDAEILGGIIEAQDLSRCE